MLDADILHMHARACLLACFLGTAALQQQPTQRSSLLSRAVESLQKVVSEAGSSGSADALHLDLQSFK